MKKQNGKIVLGKEDIRFGNLILCKEKDHYMMCDVAGMWSMRMHSLSQMYTLIEMCVENNNMAYLESILIMYYSIGTTPPDSGMINDLYDAYTNLLERIKATLPQVDDKEQEKILQEEQSFYQTKEELIKQISQDDRPETDTQG